MSHPSRALRSLGLGVLLALASGAPVAALTPAAHAAETVPVLLPAGQHAEDWADALAARGFAITKGPLLAVGPSVQVVDRRDYWELVVRDWKGDLQSVNVAPCTSPGERDDLLFLLTTLMGAAPEPVVPVPAPPPAIIPAPPVASVPVAPVSGGSGGGGSGAAKTAPATASTTSAAATGTAATGAAATGAAATGTAATGAAKTAPATASTTPASTGAAATGAAKPPPATASTTPASTAASGAGAAKTAPATASTTPAATGAAATGAAAKPPPATASTTPASTAASPPASASTTGASKASTPVATAPPRPAPSSGNTGPWVGVGGGVGVRPQAGVVGDFRLDGGWHVAPSVRIGVGLAARTSAALTAAGDGNAMSDLDVVAEAAWVAPIVVAPVVGLYGGVASRSFTRDGEPLVSAVLPILGGELGVQIPLGSLPLHLEPSVRVQGDLRQVQLLSELGEAVLAPLEVRGGLVIAWRGGR